MELSPKKKNDRNFASCATRNDAVSRHFLRNTNKNPFLKSYFYIAYVEVKVRLLSNFSSVLDLLLKFPVTEEAWSAIKWQCRLNSRPIQRLLR
jgi:hypothetical protein